MSTSTLNQPLTAEAKQVNVEVVDDEGCCAATPLPEAELKRRALFRETGPLKCWRRHLTALLGHQAWREGLLDTADAEATIRLATAGLGSMQPTTINTLFQVAAKAFHQACNEG